MKNKRFARKILIDIGMTVCLLLLMPYSLLGETAHEWVGIVMFVLFLMHHICNRKWLASIAKGNDTVFRRVQAALVFIMLVLMAGSMISGIVLSNHIFKMVRIDAAYGMAGQIHMFCAFWGFVVMSLHLGIHWNIVVIMTGRLWKTPSMVRKWAARIVAIVAAGYGAYAFGKRQFSDYLLMKTHFLFYDYTAGIVPFVADYLAVMVFLAFLGYYGGMLLRKIN